MNNLEIKSIIVRYVILVLVGIPNLYIFYFIFTPLTVEPTLFILKIIDSSAHILQEAPTTIFFKGFYASIIPACIAGAAYYLLLILNLTTPMNIKKRTRSILFLFSSFLVLNLIRISFFAFLLYKGYQYFDLTHTATWYFGSTLLVVLIWFSNVRIFKIKNIPVYTDMKYLYSEINRKNRNT